MKSNICGHCANMKPTDGYCPRVGAYVNFFAEAPKRCYVGPEELEDACDGKPNDPLRTEQKEKRVWKRGYSLEEGMKYCPACNRILPKDQFCVSKARYDGLNWECKECAARRSRERKTKDLYTIGKDGPRRER